MHEAIQHVGHRQTRNRGTIGGSLCHLDPSAELVTVAAAMDATVTVQGPNGTRQVEFAAFPVAFMTPAIELNELVTAVRFPAWPDGHGYGFVEFSRRHGDFAIVSAAALLTEDARRQDHPRVGDARRHRVAPVRATEVEQALVGQTPDDKLLREACEACRKYEALDDIHAPASYRQHLATVMSRRALEQARARLEEPRQALNGQPMTETRKVALTVNGKRYEAEAEVRLTLADFIRHTLGLTGTHLGCEHGVCGACTILLDGLTARSCLMLAVQADGHDITTVEGLAPSATELSPLQEAFRDNHGLQCGFCTPGMLTTLTEFLRDNPDPTEQDVRIAISGNLCRCTGYQNIVAAALDAAKRLQAARTHRRDRCAKRSQRPSPVRGRAGRGARRCRPPPHPSPASGEGATRGTLRADSVAQSSCPSASTISETG